MTAYGTVKSAVEALKLGAIDYLTKPLDIQELKIAVKDAVKNVKTEEVSDKDFPEIIGRSKDKRDSWTVLRISPTDATVLISGESGTGKELIANSIHQRARGMMGHSQSHCAALTETLMESEHFGR